MKSKARLYFQLMRLHQPTGIFLLLWPCLISLNMASSQLNLKLIIVFIIGSILMRAAGCIINDLIDHDIDNQVARTKDRPITSGKISFKEAIIFLFLLLFLSSLLLFCLNMKAILVALASVILVCIYPFCKRFTYWPQLVLGLTYNIGVFVAWLSVRESITLVPSLLYIGCVFWTLGYDTIYAHQDLEDDMRLGLKSTAIKLGDKTIKYLNGFYSITATMFVFSGNLSMVGKYYNVLIVPALLLLFWQIRTLEIKDPANCACRFKSNILVGALVFIATLSKNGGM